MIEKIRERSRLARENIIAKRSLKENQIKTFRESLSRLSPESMEKLGNVDFDKLDARVLFPSLYSENPSLEQYEAERKAYAEFMQPFVVLRRELMERAKEELNL